MDRRVSHRERRVWDAASEHLTAAGTCPPPSRPRRRAGTSCHGFSPGERRSDHPSGRDLYSCPLSTTIAHFALKTSSGGLSRSWHGGVLTSRAARICPWIYSKFRAYVSTRTDEARENALPRPRQGDRIGLDRFAGMFYLKSAAARCASAAPCSAATQKMQKNRAPPHRTPA
jgi:hypothetical protein